jgi:peptidoglycan/LPS O-acetylase OafA/YrhL
MLSCLSASAATVTRLPAPSRTPALDGLRGIACAGIVLLHVWMFDWGLRGRPERSTIEMLLGQMHLGVPLFFALSGFLIYRPFVAAALDGRAGPHLGRYVLRRAARILPAYWAALFGAFAVLTAIGHPNTVPAGELPRFLLFAQNHSETTRGQLDPPMWTLAVEVSFYALVPVIALLAARIGAARARQAALPAALIALGIALQAAAVAGGWPRTVTTSLLTNLAPFAAGMLAASLGHGRTLSRRAGVALVGAGVAAVALDAVWIALRLGPQVLRDVDVHVPAFAGFAAIIAGLSASGVRGAVLTSAPLRLLGTLSYGIYLWHFPVIFALRGTGHWPADLPAALALTAAITVALATTSWLALERPALRWASRRAGSPRPARTPAAARRSRRPAQAALGTAPGPT